MSSDEPLTWRFQGVSGFLRGGARPPIEVIVGFVDDHRTEFGVEFICKHLQVAPSSYYAARKRQTGLPRRIWALEGTGSFAAGLMLFLTGAGERVVEVGALKRSRGAKNDRIDAIRAARQALSREEQGAPRSGGPREALRMVFPCREGVLVSRTKAINELKSLIVLAPEHLRAQLRGRTLTIQLSRIEQLQVPATAPIEHRLSVITLQSIAARVRFLPAQLGELDPQLLELIKQHPAGPALLAEPGVGPVVAAQLLISWSHPGRVGNEAAFASLAGVAPLETSSGQRSRHRLNRGVDRALNRALHTVAITRMRCHPETRAYEIRRRAEGKTHRDIRRSVKRALARRLYRTIEAATRLHQEVTLAA